MTLRLVLAAYGLENVRPYRVGAGRNNEHWYVGAGLVLRRYGLFRSDAAIGCEHAIVRQLRERGWPVAVPIPSDAGRLVVADDGRRYALFPRLAGRRGIPERAATFLARSYACRAAYDVVMVQRAPGHRTASVTLNTCSHWWPSAENRTRAAAAVIMAEALGNADSVRTGGQR